MCVCVCVCMYVCMWYVCVCMYAIAKEKRQQDIQLAALDRSTDVDETVSSRAQSRLSEQKNDDAHEDDVININNNKVINDTIKMYDV